MEVYDVYLYVEWLLLDEMKGDTAQQVQPRLQAWLKRCPDACERFQERECNGDKELFRTLVEFRIKWSSAFFPDPRIHIHREVEPD